MTAIQAELVTFGATATSRADRDAVLAILQDLRTHLEWAGARSPQKKFRLLSFDGPGGPAVVGARFASTGAAMNGTFHDTSVVTVSEPYAFAFDTQSRLVRRHGPELEMRFAHRYDVATDGTGSRIVYSCRGHDASYVPYWLRPGMRTMTRWMIDRSMARQLRLLARLAEERAVASASG